MDFRRKLRAEMKIEFVLSALLLLFSVMSGVESQCTYDCSKHLELGERCNITSPDFPNVYKGEHYCIWNVTSNYVIRMNCEVDLPWSNTCGEDYILIYFAKKHIHRYCGSTKFDFDGLNVTVALDSVAYSKGGKFICQLETVKQFDKNDCTCGHRNEKSMTVGGKNININEYTMTAGLLDSSDMTIFCDATIISDQYVLTAAHCIVSRNISMIHVIVGAHNMLEDEDVDIFRMRKCDIHPNYGTYVNDIAVCSIADTMKFGSKISSACLPFVHKNDLFHSSNVIAVGWSKLEDNEYVPKQHTTDLSVMKISDCTKKYSQHGITRKNICTFTEATNSCKNSTGGPILWLNPDTQNLVLIGIKSYSGDCSLTKPTVGTHIGNYLKWIQSQTPGVQYCKIE